MRFRIKPRGGTDDNVLIWCLKCCTPSDIHTFHDIQYIKNKKTKELEKKEVVNKHFEFEITHYPQVPPSGFWNYKDRLELSCTRCKHKVGHTPDSLSSA